MKARSPVDAKTARKKPAKKPTARRLRNIALYYLKRFPSSASNLKAVLRRRVLRMTLEDPAPRAEAFGHIDTIVADLVSQGAVNDLVFARGKAYQAAALKKPARKTQMKLAAKGVAKDVIAQVMAETTSEESEFEAALAIARRRRLGPFRTTARDRDTDRKDMGALARAGLSFDVAKKVMAYDDGSAES
ncbi:MAG: RecX family transcriptional regulator [Rhodospirillaceae bacterium]|nr:RecX family transcriptional regulator [Rhodospirillaceae bacterium]